MQRGTARPRSESEEEDTTAIPTAPDALLSSDSRPRQRRRVDSSSPVLASAAHTPVIPITPISDIPSIDRIQQDSPSQLRIPTPVSTMGPPHLHGDIVAPHEAAEAGPSSSPSRTNGTNGHATSPTHSHVRLVKPAGSLMYEDDKDWVEDPNKDDNIAPDDDTELIANARPALRPNGGRRMPVDREEVVRLILQGLRDIGYNQSAEVLEAESGFQLSSGSASDFEAAVLGGRWSEALGLLPQLGIDTSTPPTPSESIPNEDPPASSSASLKSVAMNSTHTVPSTKPMSPAQEMRFLISQQKYLEYLEAGQQKKALSTLRSELAPVAKDPEVLHNLSGFMMCLDKDDLYERSSWDGAARTSRRKLLEQLQTHISPKVMVPQRRLATLLEQARQYQALSCPYHQGSEPSSLYTNHQCDAGQFPSITTHILADHTDEVWRIEWSPDGLMLASAGKDRLVVIWGLEFENGTWTVRPLHHLREHREPVDVMAWSPNGKTLVTGADKSLYLWDTQTGEQKRIAAGASPHVDQISAIQWRPDGTEFTVSSMDCKLVTYSANGAMLRQWASTPFQIRDFAFSPDTTKIIAVTATLKRVTEGSKLKPSVSSRGAEPTTLSSGAGHSDEWSGFAYVPMEHGVMMIRLVDREILDYHVLDGAKDRNKDIASMKLSWDASKVLLSINPDEIQLWAVEPRIKPLRQYAGHMHQQYLIRSAFGATKDRFVLSGSEDGHVYVWQANSPHPIQVLAGHDKVVNSVAWNPVTSRRIFASCSDDHTIRLWQAPSSPGESGQEAGVAESEK